MNLILDVLEVVFALVLTVGIEDSLDVFFEALLLGVQRFHNIVVLFLLFSVLGLQLLRLAPHVPELDDLRCEHRLAIGDLLADLLDGFSDLLQSFILCVV